MSKTPSIIPPREPVSNWLYRIDLRKWCLQSAANRQYVMDKCRESFFFWCYSFSVCFEPRLTEMREGAGSIRGFLPYDDQYEVIEKILENLGIRDIGIEKARGRGASWIVLLIFIWDCIFSKEGAHFGVMSRSIEAADDYKNSSSLGWKLDHCLKHLPIWMIGKKGEDWERVTMNHTWTFKKNGSSIVATACTDKAFSGGRLKALLMDEYSKFNRGDDDRVLGSTGPVTPCRLFVSTYQGADGAYYRIMRGPETPGLVKLVLRWETDPTRNQNMFRLDERNRKLLAVDSDNSILPEYTETFFKDYYPVLKNGGFPVSDRNKQWSPWYVGECVRGGTTPREIAQEYDINPAGAGSQFFPSHTIEKLIKQCEEPIAVGEVIYDPQDLKVETFDYRTVGPLYLWTRLRMDKHPPLSRYVIGADLSQGAGGSMGSNSVLSIVDCETCTKVGEYVSPVTPQTQFAEIAISLCRWFRGPKGEPAFLIWESNNAANFRERVLESDFRNFYYQYPRDSIKRKSTKRTGWASTKSSEYELLTLYKSSLMDGLFHNPSKIALRECLCYRYTTGDKIEFVSVVSADEDPANAGQMHADRCIADALANMAMTELNGGARKAEFKEEKEASTLNPPEGSYLHRRLEAKQKERKEEYEW